MTESSTPAIEPAPQSRSTELPIVVIGEEGGRIKPAVRLLPGRINVSFILYPIYALILGAGALAVNFALHSGEWSPSVIATAYGLLFAWHWVYGVTYRYRRWFLKSFCVLISLFMGLSLSYLMWERAQPQLIPLDGRLVERGEVAVLEIVGLATILSALLLLAHVLILGRGYREKQVHGKKKSVAGKAKPGDDD